MKELLNILTIKEDNPKTSSLIFLILAAYLFSIVLRMIWVYHFSGSPGMFWNDQLMINTNDGYMFAEGARDILAGFHQDNDLSKIGSPTSQLTAFFAKILPFSFESIILYMPTFLGSLLVVPIVLIGRALNHTHLGFAAALLGGIVWSYYNRTMTGYYDTDMLIIVLPTFILWSFILGVTHNKNRYLLIATFSIIAYNFWYSGSYSLNIAMAGMLFLYTLAFDRKNIYNYKLLLFVAIAIAKIPVIAQILLSLALFMLFHSLKERAEKFVFPLLGIGILAVVFTGGMAPILVNLTNYVFRTETSSNIDTALHFFNVVQTVREAGSIPFETFANRISGHTITFILSTIGYILLVIRFPVMLLALPMAGLGFLAISGGLRFTVYAVPIMALGAGYIIFLFSKFVSMFFGEKKRAAAETAIVGLLLSVFLYPNISHIIDYKVPAVFNKQEVAVLDGLKSMASREDYVLAWWDYGYPIRYYSDTKVLIDGGKHTGSANFPASLALTYPQVESANMARLEVEYTEQGFIEKRIGNRIQHMMDDYGFEDPNLFLDGLKSKEFKLPEKTRDVYYYLPLRMLNIYQTVRLFSNLDLSTGKQFAQPFLYEANSFRELDDRIVLGNGIEVNKKTNTILIGNQQVPINSLFVTVYDNTGKLKVQQQRFNIAAPISLIYMKSYNKFLVLDQQTLNSAYIQLFVFENYDRELFEPVILDPLAKVYRLKK